MNTLTYTSGSRVVIVTEQDGRYTARLYVNRGESTTTRTARASSLAGIERAAMRLLAAS